MLFFGGSGVFAQSYTPIFSEDFSLEENHSPVGNGWKATTNNPNPLSCGTTGDNAWEVRNGRLQPRCYQSSNPILLRPSSESLKNGRADILFTVFSGNVNEYAQWRIIARHTYDTGNNINYYYEGVISPGHNWIAVGRKNSTNNNYALSSMKSSLITIPVDTLLKAELITESISSSETRITLNLYNLGDGGNLLATTTMLDTTPELQQSGQWGVWTNQRPTVNKFDLYAIDADINISAVNAISFGNDLTIHLVDDGDNVITFSDDTGGIFSPNPVILNAENNYQATVLYSPIKAGNVIISGTQSANNSKEIRHKLFVSPYTTIIGFIGDSISLDANYHTVEETILNLISGFSSSNVASNGSTSTSWINNNTNIAQMYNSGVEVVSIMLGTNDTRQDQKRTPEAYKVSMQALIDKLKDDFRLVILNEPPAIDRNQSFASSLWDEQSNTRLSGYIEKLNELVMENDGFVIRGDTTVYQYFMDNPTCLGDGIHPNNCGKIYIGKQWANAIKSALDYQINPNAEFIGANGDEHTL
ncbi:MAG: hypothetical protein LBU27_01490 [Candidatus Peribacteria bacterium]|nr:hypothetical protein [Candidatus Peribacteria bacterium]